MLLTLVLRVERFELHRLMHPFHSDGSDMFFTYFTHLADGLVPLALSLILLGAGSYRSFLMMGAGCGLGAIVTQLLKRLPFADVDRPFMFMKELGDLHWIPGLDLHHHFSFPSGHATAAFNMFFALAVLVPGKWKGVVFGMLAVLLAYSRVYLSQHFTVDILAGSAIGTVTSMLVHWWLYRSSFAQRAWLSRGLVRHRNQ